MPMGFVYVLFNPSIPGKVKIGLTTGTSEDRAKSLYETGVADHFHVAYDELVSDCGLVEHNMHERFKGFRKNKSREFFEIPIKDAVRALQEIAKPFLVPESALKNRCEILPKLQRKFPGVLRRDLSSVAVIQLPDLYMLESRRRAKRGEKEELVVREGLGFLSGIEDILDVRHDVKVNANEFIGNLNLATLLVISEALFNEEGLAKAIAEYNAP
jgi:hypothetical protein